MIRPISPGDVVTFVSGGFRFAGVVTEIGRTVEHQEKPGVMRTSLAVSVPVRGMSTRVWDDDVIDIIAGRVQVSP